MDRRSLYQKLLCCPRCTQSLAHTNDTTLECVNCKQLFPIVDGIPILLPTLLTDEKKLSLEKWDHHYQNMMKHAPAETLLARQQHEEEKYTKNTLDYIARYCQPRPNIVYVEIGCGPFFIGHHFAQAGAFVIGIDYSFEALILAQQYLRLKGITNYLLVCGDITHMPLRDAMCDVLYGGGVIEHFKDTEVVVRQIYRVLKPGGVSVNTVPALNIGALTYRQVWGNIPNLPILKSLAEFLHVRLLRSRHMIFGYELSFTKKGLRNIFRRGGFGTDSIIVERFHVTITFDYLHNPYIRAIAFRLVEHALFWPAIAVVAVK